MRSIARKVITVLVVFVAVIAAESSWSFANSARGQSARQADTYDLTLVITLAGTDQSLFARGDSACEGFDAKVGAPIFFLDDEGAMLTVMPLTWGVMTQYSPYNRICEFEIPIRRLPDANSYQVVFGPFYSYGITPDYLDAHDWRLVLEYSTY